jgi:hypothetical protein
MLRFLVVEGPVDEAVRYEHRVFPKLTDKTIYHGPPAPDVDQAWDDLYVPCESSDSFVLSSSPLEHIAI